MRVGDKITDIVVVGEGQDDHVRVLLKTIAGLGETFRAGEVYRVRVEKVRPEDLSLEEAGIYAAKKHSQARVRARRKLQ